MDKNSFEVSGLSRAFQEALKDAEAGDFVSRLAAGDASLWKKGAEHQALINNSLGWRFLPAIMREHAPEITAFAAEVRAAGFTEVVLLGMGGSSLAPLVFAGVFGAAEGWPVLTVLDSTDPVAIEKVLAGLTLKTLFIISSKSGSTVEPNTLFQFFYDKICGIGVKNPGDNFVAITDPGSALEALGREKSFRRVFQNPSDIGGRFSALSFFGLVPAALAGIDIKLLIESAARAVITSDNSADVEAQAGICLGAAIGAAALGGRDKLTLFVSEKLPAFGLWVEQLVAESTGKENRGIVPVTGEPLGGVESYGTDRVFVDLRLADEPAGAALDALEEAGHPVIKIRLAGPYDIGYEFMRWEIATALAGRTLGINPFDQPDVESAKILARARLEEKSAGAPGIPLKAPGKKIFLSEAVQGVPGLRGALDNTDAAAVLKALFAEMKKGDYIALLTYYSTFDTAIESMAGELQGALMLKTKKAVQAGFGPRYLHSTGQIHKGGPNNGIYLIFTHAAADDLRIPGAPFTFSELELSQAYGDMEALMKRGRRVILFEAADASAANLKAYMDIIGEALS
ncbi:MAG: glucose-6-phosphate isomerase [Thermodesulfobacteriota bacterium]